jgi:hypothetical protein
LDARNILHGTIVYDDRILHLVIPQTKMDELAQELGTHGLEFSSKDIACLPDPPQPIPSQP